MAALALGRPFNNRRVKEVPNNINDISEDYKDFVDDKVNEEIKIYVTRQLVELPPTTQAPNYLGLTIQYKLSNRDIVELLCTNSINDLPIVLNNYILSYICDTYLNIDIKIKYPVDYPFKPPQYSLVDIRTNASNRLYIKEFIERKILKYNTCNRGDNCYNWSPAISIKKDILQFMVSMERIRGIINK